MSIQNNRQLGQAHEQLDRLSQALAALKHEMAERNPFGFRIMAEGPLEEIRRLREAIAIYTGEMELEKAEVDFRFRLSGRSVKWRDTPMNVIISHFKALRDGVRALAKHHVLRINRHSPHLTAKSMGELCLVDLQPGSLDVGLRLPGPSHVQTDIFEVVSPIELAVRDFVSVANWATNVKEMDQLISIFPDTPVRRQALHSLRLFIPSQRSGVESVTLYGRMVQPVEVIRISAEISDLVNEVIELSVSEHEISYNGEIREIDLDTLSFQLRRVPVLRTVKCSFSKELLLTAEACLGKAVSVVGSLRLGEDGKPEGPLEVAEISLLRDSKE